MSRVILFYSAEVFAVCFVLFLAPAFAEQTFSGGLDVSVQYSDTIDIESLQVKCYPMDEDGWVITEDCEFYEKVVPAEIPIQMVYDVISMIVIGLLVISLAFVGSQHYIYHKQGLTY